MDRKVFIVLFAIFGASISQSVDCNYQLATLGGRRQYACRLVIQNPDGFDNFTQIEGFHFPGLTNVFVTAVLRSLGSETQNVPQVFCSQFPHTTYMDLTLLNIEEVSEFAFRGCRNLDFLRLYNNRITRLPPNVFAFNRHLRYIDLDRNSLTELDENLFENQWILETLELTSNSFTNLPAGLLRNQWNLRSLYMRRIGVSALNPAWFEHLINLQFLDLNYNSLNQTIPPNTFENLVSLRTLYLAHCRIDEVNPMWFRIMAHLEYLFMYDNNLTAIPANVVANSPDITVLDFGINFISEISPDAFNNLPNIWMLSLDENEITRLHQRWFEDKPGMYALYLDFNRINFLPSGIFSQLHELRELGLWSNNIRTINRDAFGSMDDLWYVDMDDNSINAVDERFLMDTPGLSYFYFQDNICASVFFFNFGNNREENIREFNRCMNNFRFTRAFTTEGNAYTFVNGFNPGMHFEVFSDEEVSIALTSFNVVWNPMIEIVIANATTRIIRNQATEVAIVPNQNVYRPGQWNGFRVTWSNQVVLVFEAGEEFPFIAYTMEDWFLINHCGFRSQHDQASWFTEPIRVPAN